MLETLRIKNLVVIDEAEIPFMPGLNILSGETGAGKSIVIQAISLLLGSRASAELIRAECDEAVVEGLFDLSKMPWMIERMERLGFTVPQAQEAACPLLIKRVVHRGGRHRISVNGELATLTLLQQLCEGLIDLCGQHEHQSLIKSQKQLELLDRFGALEQQAAAVRDLFAQASTLREQAERLRGSSEDRFRRADFLRFQIEELRAAALTPGEDEALQREKSALQTADSRVVSVEEARSAFDGTSGGDGESTAGALTLIQRAVSRLRAISTALPQDPAHAVLAVAERALAEAEEASLALSRYAAALEANPGRLEEVQERLSRIAELRRKYGATVDAMIETLGHLERELTEVEQTDHRLSELQAQLVETTERLRSEGMRLSDSRKAVAQAFSERVTAQLKDLRLEDASLCVEVETREKIEDWSAAAGADSIQFMVQTNRGEPARPLGKVASGGELSRIMLAVRRVIADRGGIGVYLFDEIDAGIGGQTAFVVGRKLKNVSQHNQVICITHLPQVASFADHHLSVQKLARGRRVLTEIRALDMSGRREELARMLGGGAVGAGAGGAIPASGKIGIKLAPGAAVSSASLKAAQELLNQAKAQVVTPSPAPASRSKR